MLDPQLEDTFLFDISTNKFLPLGSLKPLSRTRITGETISSPNGNHILTSIHDKKWSVVNMDDLSHQLIDKENLNNPVFAENGRTAFFESDNDLWKYDFSTNKLTQLNIAPQKCIEIINTIRKNSPSGQHNSINFIPAKNPLILRIKDLQNNRTSYLTWKDGKQQIVIEPTANQIEEIAYSRNFAHFYALEQNFQFAPRLLAKRMGEPQKILLNSYGSNDLKIDIVNYTINDGTHLKAVLYYPKNFKTDKKYPMVVHVYQIQSSKANKFLKPGYNNPDGIDIRTLIEKGYFVFLPDTIINNDGPGVSGLECVHKALDAIQNIQQIDFKKIGLVGHSFGGYLTDFIATHSDRFATYVSGSGDSDPINSYFSYNYHFPGPYYWDFEIFGNYKIGTFKDLKGKYFKNNPIHFVDQVDKPMLLWTGKKDRRVPWERTMEFYIGLKRNSNFVIALFYPDAGHVFRNNSLEKKDLQTRVLQWWDYFLKDKKDVGWIKKQLMKDAF
ncbi:Prolyl oligopeptidase family protein [compost metagenome]